MKLIIKVTKIIINDLVANITKNGILFRRHTKTTIVDLFSRYISNYYFVVGSPADSAFLAAATM